MTTESIAVPLQKIETAWLTLVRDDGTESKPVRLDPAFDAIRFQLSFQTDWFSPGSGKYLKYRIYDANGKFRIEGNVGGEPLGMTEDQKTRVVAPLDLVSK